MKNLTKEEKMAHDTKVLSNASNMKAAITAEQMSRRNSTFPTTRTNIFPATGNGDIAVTGVHDKANSKGAEIAQWATDLFDNSEGNGDGFGTFHGTHTATSTAMEMQMQMEVKMDLSSNIKSRFKSANAIKIKKTALDRGSRFSSAPATESFQLESFDPERRSNAFEFDSAATSFANFPIANDEALVATTPSRDGSKAPPAFFDQHSKHVTEDFGDIKTREREEGDVDGYSETHGFTNAFGPAEPTKSIPRYSFVDEITSVSKRRSHPSKSKMVPNLPSRDAIAPTRRASSLPLPTTSKYSFVPMVTSKTVNVSNNGKTYDNDNDNKDTDLWNDFGRSSSKKNNRRPSAPQHVDTSSSSYQDDADDTFCQADFSDPMDNVNVNDKAFSSDPFAPCPKRNNAKEKLRHNNAFQNNGNTKNIDGNFGWKGFGTSSAFETIPSGWDTEEENDSDNDENDYDGFITQKSSGPSASSPASGFKRSSFPVANSSAKSELSETSPTGVAEFDSTAVEWLKGSPPRSSRRHAKAGTEDKGGKNRPDRGGLPRMNLFSKDDSQRNSSSHPVRSTGWL